MTKKIGDGAAAAALSATDKLEISQGGATQLYATPLQLANYVRGLGGQLAVFRSIGVNMNSTADQALTKVGVFTKWRVAAIFVTNASISLTTAAGGFYTGASKGGTILVANTQVYTTLSAASKILNCTLAASANTDVFDASTAVYLSLTTPQAVAATADAYVIAQILEP